MPVVVSTTIQLVIAIHNSPSTLVSCITRVIFILTSTCAVNCAHYF
jgi:hypothetical protein